MMTTVLGFLVLGAAFAGSGDAVPCTNPRLVWGGTLVPGTYDADIAIDRDGNVFVCGYFGDTVDFDPTDGVDQRTTYSFYPDLYVVEVLAEGSYAWAHTVGGPESDDASGVAAASDGSVIVVGSFANTVDFDPTPAVDERTAVGKVNGFVTKLAPDGTYLWTLTFAGRPYQETRVWASRIALDDDGNMLITGFCSALVDFDPTSDVHLENCGYDVFLTKLTPDGSHVWTRLLRATGARPMSPGAVAVDTEGNAYVSGMFSGTVDFDPGPGVDQRVAMSPYDDFFVTKLHPDGSYGWTATYNAFGAAAIGLDPTGGVVLAGYFYGTVDFDPDPIGTDWRISVEGEYDDVPDIFVTALHADGSYAWTYTVGGHRSDVAYGVAVDGAGNAYATGVFWGTVDFDAGPGVDQHDPETDGNIFLTKLYSDGSYAWTQTLGVGGEGYRAHVAVNPIGGVVVAGQYWTPDVADFDPGCEVRDPGPPGTFIVQLTCPDLTTDLDVDGDTDLSDFAGFQNCFTGPAPTTCETGCTRLDFDTDDDIDLFDFSFLQNAFAPVD